jgi:type III restriction enzyme
MTVREVLRSLVNYVVADTRKWEQEAAYHIDPHSAVDAFVKNAGLGFALPYLYNGQGHDYVPDFIIRMKTAISSADDVERITFRRVAVSLSAPYRRGR